jgi:hypothetical protein
MKIGKNTLWLSGLFTTGALLLLLNGCSSVPVSGRQQLNLVSDKEVTEMSIQQFEELKKQSKILRDRKTQLAVEKIAFDIIEEVNWW